MFNNSALLPITGIAILFSWSLADAQLSVPGPPPSSGLSCGDFDRNPDGSWSPVREVTVNGVTLGTGAPINQGMSFGGIDLAATLNERCQPLVETEK
jgi:hypothetical protein